MKIIDIQYAASVSDKAPFLDSSEIKYCKLFFKMFLLWQKYTSYTTIRERRSSFCWICRQCPSSDNSDSCFAKGFITFSYVLEEKKTKINTSKTVTYGQYFQMICHRELLQPVELEKMLINQKEMQWVCAIITLRKWPIGFYLMSDLWKMSRYGHSLFRMTIIDAICRKP